MTVVALLSALAVGFGLLLLVTGPAQRRRRLDQAGLGTAAAFGGAALGWLTTGWAVAALLGASLGALFPRSLRAHRQARHRAAVTDALAETAAGLRDAVGAGHGLQDALTGMAHYGPQPLRADLAQLVGEARLRGLDAALPGFARRVDTPLADLLTAILLLNTRLGGRNLTQSLDGLAAAIRAEALTLREVRARQAEQRLSAQVVAATPLAALLLFQAGNPALLQPYDTTPGQLVLLGAALLIAAGYTLMVRLGQPPPGTRLTPPSTGGGA